MQMQVMNVTELALKSLGDGLKRKVSLHADAPRGSLGADTWRRRYA